nr:beta-defensin 124 isoform X1 [Symphalangus syndactylus]XP_055122141.1 beta-defensin 124 isoform X1 [Symphalangus syndactylus]
MTSEVRSEEAKHEGISPSGSNTEEKGSWNQRTPRGLWLLSGKRIGQDKSKRRSEFKRCWKGQGACRTYCTRQETYMHLCPDASLCCLSYALKPPPVPKHEYE